MSENERDETKAEEAIDETVVTESTTDGPKGAAAGTGTEDAEKLTELMATEAQQATPRQRPDLQAEAIAAAQEAVAKGNDAITEAARHLASEPVAQKAADPAAKRRELVLRCLLAVNVIAMIVVIMLPTKGGGTTEPVTPPEPPPSTHTAPQTPVLPKLPHKYEAALQASATGDYAKALALLGEYMEESPNMAPSRRISVYHQMAHYAQMLHQYKTASEYERKASMLMESHRLPSDLVAMAKAALENGDQEQLRRVWARFLLQQRQIPSSLYQHVAEAYLQLGDSYRIQANDAAERARLDELKRIETLLREQAKNQGQGK